MSHHPPADENRAVMVAAIGTTAGQPVIYNPRFASDPYPWGHGPDLNDGLRFNSHEIRPASPEDES